jgi:L-amino acid N-acyltransferase YncA
VPDTRPSPLLLPARLTTRLRTRGPGELIQLAISRIKENISSTETLIVFFHGADNGPIEKEGLSFRRATTSDAERYAHDIGTDSAASFARRLSDSTRSYIVEMNGRLVHASWVTLSAAWTRELRAYLKPPPGDAYVYESFTRSDARGRGVYPFALRNICATLTGEGVGTIWVAVEAHNAASVRAVTKAGFEEGFRITYSRKLGRFHIEEPTGAMADIGRTFVNRKL